jgi:hypothetical protein
MKNHLAAMSEAERLLPEAAAIRPDAAKGFAPDVSTCELSGLSWSLRNQVKLPEDLQSYRIDFATH